MNDPHPDVAHPSAISTAIRSLDDRVLRLWRIRLVLMAVPFCLAVGIGVGVLHLLLGAGAALIVLGVAVAAGWSWTRLVWRAWRFAIGPDALVLEHGVLVRVRSTVPYHRIQHIDTEAGPLERRLGLATLVLHTAAATTDATIPGIDADEIDEVRQQILARVGDGDAV